MVVFLRFSGLVLAAEVLAGCLAPFNDAPGAGCDGGGCLDATARDVRLDRGGGPDRAGDTSLADAAGPDAFDEAGACLTAPDGGPCGAGDPCHDVPTCVAGVCTPHAKTDGSPCGFQIDVCHSVPMCTGGVCGASTALADGTQWKPGDDNARCCAGIAVETTSVDNCGVCTIKCDTGKGQSCNPVNGHYFCTPCTVSDCWSGCCSETTSAHCSPSNCATGSCQSPDICPDGSHCQSDIVNYCSY